MANDGSMASLMEVWIRDTIAALAEFPTENVRVYEGSQDAQFGKRLIEQMTRNRSPFATVLFEGDAAKPLEEGENAYEPTYGIYVVVQNEREGTARTGDDVNIGTNKARDLIRAALHNQAPNIGAGGFFTDRTEFRGARVVFERADAFVLRCELTVRESPTA